MCVTPFYYTLELNLKICEYQTFYCKLIQLMNNVHVICHLRNTNNGSKLNTCFPLNALGVSRLSVCVCILCVLLTLLQKTIRFTGCRSGYSHISCQEMNTFSAMFWFQIQLLFENGLILNFFKSLTTISFFQ